MLCTLMLAARECSWTEEDCERMAEAPTLTLMPSRHISDWPRVSSQRLQQRKRVGVQAKQRYGRQAISMVWDYAEINPFAGAGGDWAEIVNGMARAFAAHAGGRPSNKIDNVDARYQTVRDVVISTDPPYYDNVGYADLSDHFYVWLRPTLSKIWPDLFRRIFTPKDEELVATAARHGGRLQAEKFFMDGIAVALGAVTRSSVRKQPLKRSITHLSNRS
jgi:adenine-specific DNA methylase